MVGDWLRASGLKQAVIAAEIHLSSGPLTVVFAVAIAQAGLKIKLRAPSQLLLQTLHRGEEVGEPQRECFTGFGIKATGIKATQLDLLWTDHVGAGYGYGHPWWSGVPVYTDTTLAPLGSPATRSVLVCGFGKPDATHHLCTNSASVGTPLGGIEPANAGYAAGAPPDADAGGRW